MGAAGQAMAISIPRTEATVIRPTRGQAVKNISHIPGTVAGFGLTEQPTKVRGERDAAAAVWDRSARETIPSSMGRRYEGTLSETDQSDAEAT
jgi:hypothetical protein